MRISKEMKTRSEFQIITEPLEREECGRGKGDVTDYRMV